jgi:hypothetical protein
MIKQVRLSKEFKIGLPSFSNITIGADITWEVKEGEQFNYNEAWDLINQELSSQTSLDPAWITQKDYKNFFKTTIKVDKKGGEKK